MTSGVTPQRSQALPREIAPGVFWLGQCYELSHRGRTLHTYNSVYLVAGTECSALVEAGPPQDLAVLAEQIAQLLDGGVPPLKYLFVTHTETPHASGLGQWLNRYADTVVCGDISDLHLVFPEFIDRFRALAPGQELDLGGRSLVAIEAVFRDFDRTLWAFDTAERVLFAGDGFAYSHYHEADHCGLMAEEAETLDVPDMMALFSEAAFAWTRYVDIEPFIERLDELVLTTLDVSIIAPTHGLPIGDPEATLPVIRTGLRRGSLTKEGQEIS
jgi:flavorubredoxin